MNWYKIASDYVPLRNINVNDIVHDAINNLDMGSGDWMIENAIAEATKEALNSFQSHNYHSVISTEYSKNETEIRKRALEILREKIEMDLHNLINERLEWSKRFPIWRAIRVKNGKTPQETINNIRLQPVGPYWSYDEHAADCHWGDYGNGTVTVTLKAKIGPQLVNWHDTLVANLDPFIGQDEKEVRLIEGKKIIITEVSICKLMNNNAFPVKLEAIV